MGNHRADVHADIPSVTPPSAYVGKRRALPSSEPAVETTSPSTYVGKRRATPVAEEPTERPMPTRLVLREPILDRDHHERAADDERITTGELRALVDATLEDTAPRLRLDGPLGAPAGLAVPGPRRTPEPEQVGPVETQAPEPEQQARPLFAPDTSSIALPRLSIAATYAADLTGDTTTTLPVISVGGNGGRRRSSGRRSLLKGMPSLPAAVGACALAAAVAGAVATAHPGVSHVASTRVTTATALTGASEIAGVSHGREVPVSRGGGRTAAGTGNAAEATADKRAEALTQLAAQAESQDAFIKKNQWGLPILAGDYHLTGRFGDVSGLWQTVHTGLDFAAPYGTPIHAVARGVVTSTGYDGSYGNKTVVTLPDGTELWYCHQSQFGTSVGDTVNEGEVIGYVGATGNVTGPHVHLEVRPGGGDPVDPDAALKAHGIDPDANQ